MKRKDHCADLVTTVGGHRDEQLVLHQYRWLMWQSMVCLRYSMDHADEVPSFLVVAIYFFGC